MNHSEIVSFLWGVADLFRDTFKRGNYQDVILPLTVLRRLDAVLAPTKPKVLEVQARYQGKIENLDPQLKRAAGFAFYNTSRYDFHKLLQDAPRPVLLRIPAAASAGGDRGRHPAGGEGHRGHAAGDGECMNMSAVIPICRQVDPWSAAG